MLAFSQYLVVAPDGKIWWSLADAIRIAAGFQLASVDQVPELRAPAPLHIANEATVRAAFEARNSALSRPRVIAKPTGLSVPAREFLFWFSQYRIEAESEIPFPDELARYVANAEAIQAGAKAFSRRTDQLEEWFEKKLEDLPADLRDLAIEVMFPWQWDAEWPETRRKHARDFDESRDPAMEGQRHYWWDFHVRMNELKAQRDQCKAIRAETITEINMKETRLARLKAEIDEMDAKVSRLEVKEIMEAIQAGRISEGEAVPLPKQPYLAYPLAFQRLEELFGATENDVAAWVWLSGTKDELPAYSHVYEIDPPPRFHFPPAGNRRFDYMAALTGAYFLESDLLRYVPPDHYITGDELMQRWAKYKKVDLHAFVSHRLGEGRLCCFHPIEGQTQWQHPGQENWPPEETALFELSKVMLVEEADLQRKDEPKAVEPRYGDPVREAELVDAFKVVPRNAEENQKWWRQRLADAKKTPALRECRAALGKRGSKGSSMWYPGRVALWLVDRGHMGQAFAGKALRKNFPELSELADQLDPPND